MAKIVAVQSELDDIAGELRRNGYTVINIYEASNPDTKVDAFLFTSNHPDIVTSFNNLTETDNISFKDEAPQSGTSAVLLNVTGLDPSHVVEILKQRLKNSQVKHNS